MPIHGGFAYAIQIRQQVFNDSVLLAYHAGTIQRRLFLPDLPDGPPIVAMDFFLDPPTISFDPANNNQLRSEFPQTCIARWGRKSRLC